MRVVDHHQRLSLAAQRLHAARRRRDVRERPAGVIQFHLGHQQGGQYRQQVGGIEAAQQRRIDLGIAPVGMHGEMQACLRQLQFFPYHGTTLKTVAGDSRRRPGLAFQPLAEGIVDVDHHPFEPGPVEQPRLGVGIAFHVAVVIEMIARQIGQHRHIENGAIDAPLRQAMRRYLHCTCRRTLLPIERKTLLQFDGVGRGIERGRECAGLVPEWGEAIAHGADDGGFAPQLRQGLGNPVRHGSLAVGAGDADHVQRTRGFTVHVRGDFTDAGLQARHPGVGDGERGIPLIVIGLPQHAVGTLRYRLCDEVAAIARFTRIGGEYRTRHGLATVVDEFGNADAEPFQNVRHGFPDAMRRRGAEAGLGLWLGHYAPPPARSSLCVIRVAVSGASGGNASWRRLAAITWANTGPATLPP